mmetsp:Transcript_73507/g.168507  ORF Transcript_73507/g.168507 Transcript_73507/m.168507 type:complete len:276 (+) Transcript_73507:31-858(+)
MAAQAALLAGGMATFCTTAYIGYMSFGGGAPVRVPKDFTFPDEKERLKTFNNLARKWDSTVRFDEMMLGMGRWRRRLCAEASGDCLEIAVGTGRNFSFYNAGKVTSLTGVDFARTMLEVALDKKKYLDPIPLKLHHANAANLHFAEDNTFDTVLDTFGICSFEEPVKALREVRRVVKPDGQVLLLEHGNASWEYVRRMLKAQLPGHVSKFGCYCNRDISKLVEEAGFQILEKNTKHFGTTVHIVAKKLPEDEYQQLLAEERRRAAEADQIIQGEG